MSITGLAFRATNDIDIVLELQPAAYESRLRPSFEPDYLVADLLHVGHRWMGSAIHIRDISKADFVIRDPDGWGRAAFDRAMAVEDPALGRVRVSTAEDLLLAKLEFSNGNLDGIQGRDIAVLLAPGRHLDEGYLRRHAAGIGVAGWLDEAERRAGR